MKIEKKLTSIINRYNELEQYLTNADQFKPEDFVLYSREFSEISDIVKLAKDYFNVKKNIENTKLLLNESDNDKELLLLASNEILILNDKLRNLEKEIQTMLLPKDKDDIRNVIIEVRAGTGGDEAALFAANLFYMYQKYAEKNNWKFETLSIQSIGIGGYKEASALIEGRNVFSKMKFESGVHRVQRVPATETQGRVHTSTATVAVLPEAEEIDVNINPQDIKIDTYRASGAGGQHVNTTDSAVRITHIPTGIVVTQQDEKSQHKNKAKAMKILLSRIYESEKQKKDLERSDNRKNQVGTGERAEKIRTYNEPHSRVTDHRIGLTLYKIDDIMKNGELDELVDKLIEDYKSKMIFNSDSE